jgi:gliding-associated putative ABC transporter substrate-binding component GldG
MHKRKALLLDAWVQLTALLALLVVVNLLAARHFSRLDLTRDHVYTLSEQSRTLAGRIERPLFVKVYFTAGLEAPYNNHQQILVDKLEEFRAYSHGLMEIQVVDPTGRKELEEEAQRFGIAPIQYAYRGAERSELKRVFMGASFVYGERQAALEAITQVGTAEYDIARTVHKLLAGDEQPTIGFAQGHGEVDVLQAGGPLETLRNDLAETYALTNVPLGGEIGVPEEVDALVLLGPQQPLDERSRYQLDQFLMRGGSLAVFLTNYRTDLRTLRPAEIYHGLEGFLGQLGVVVNRDLVIDRAQNGKMRVPVRQGRYVLQMPVNHPALPRVTDLDAGSPIVKGLDQMLFPFASSLTVTELIPAGAEVTVLARSSAQSGRFQGVRTLDPGAYQVPIPGEETGAWPLMVAVVGSFTSTFAELPIPPVPAETPFGAAVVTPDDPASKITQGAPARLVVAASADAAANNVAMMLNLADWLCQDESLIGIRSKVVQLPPLEPPATATLRWLKLADAAGGTLLLLVFGGLRLLWQRRSGRAAEVA